MAAPRFVWIIRTWSSEDTFWEHVREHKEYDIAYRKPDLLLEEIQRIILKEQTDWEDMCEGSEEAKQTRQFLSEVPTIDQIKTRAFLKFLTVTDTKTDFMQSWYVERLKIIDA